MEFQSYVITLTQLLYLLVYPILRGHNGVILRFFGSLVQKINTQGLDRAHLLNHHSKNLHSTNYLHFRAL